MPGTVSEPAMPPWPISSSPTAGSGPNEYEPSVAEMFETLMSITEPVLSVVSWNVMNGGERGAGDAERDGAARLEQRAGEVDRDRVSRAAGRHRDRMPAEVDRDAGDARAVDVDLEVRRGDRHAGNADEPDVIGRRLQRVVAVRSSRRSASAARART